MPHHAACSSGMLRPMSRFQRATEPQPPPNRWALHALAGLMFGHPLPAFLPSSHSARSPGSLTGCTGGRGQAVRTCGGRVTPFPNLQQLAGSPLRAAHVGEETSSAAGAPAAPGRAGCSGRRQGKGGPLIPASPSRASRMQVIGHAPAARAVAFTAAAPAACALTRPHSSPRRRSSRSSRMSSRRCRRPRMSISITWCSRRATPFACLGAAASGRAALAQLARTC